MIISINTVMIAFFVLSDGSSSSFLFLKVSNLADKIALLVTFLSLGLWISRNLYIELKKRHVPSLPALLRPVFLLLRKTHPAWGWIILATATIHAAYYFLPMQYFNRRMLTGIVAWALLFLLFLLGLRFQSILRRKLVKKYVRSPHVLASIAFIIAFCVHFFLRG
ncbi:MAG: hypothetical protein NVS2B12_18620 [Ktedonobacteraceae bacterium]